MPEARITIEGNATKDPELTFGQSGQARCRLSVAANGNKKNDRGEWETTSTSFFDVTCWGARAEAVADQVTKGTGVIVSGRIVQREFTDKNGENRRVFEVTADSVGVAVRAHRDGGHRQPQQQADPWATSDQQPPF